MASGATVPALWLPVAVGLGVHIYFRLPAEPPGGLAAALLVLAGLLALFTLQRPHWRHAMLVALALVFGFGAATLRTTLVAAPVIDTRLGPVFIEGTVSRVDVRLADYRLTLERLQIEGLEAAHTPRRVRLTVRGKNPPSPGEVVRLRGILQPPPPPVAPGAFDFARQAWFQGLGGVGFALAPPQRIARAAPSPRTWLAQQRHTMAQRIRASLEGPDGGIAAALMTGERGGIAPDDLDALRASGLAHLLAISGLHVGLVAGLVFFAVRLGLAAVPALAESRPVKKWSAAAALLAALAYLLLTGATVPTKRAFVMTAIVLGAVMIDRRAVSMRLVAVAASLILLIRPESLLGVSFQMSFAAVVALIAAYEGAAVRLVEWRRGASWRRRAFLYLGGVLFTTLIAGLATMPFAAYHFNQIATLGLAANAIAVPVTALWIMPWALVAYLLLPFDAAWIPLALMGQGIAVVRWVAHAVADVPGATLAIQSAPGWGLSTVVAGGLWLGLWRGAIRWTGLVGIAVGLASPLAASRPTIMIDHQARVVAVDTGDGYLVKPTARSYVARTWLRRAGEPPARPWPRDGKGAEERLFCDEQVCTLETTAGTVVIGDAPGALLARCAGAALVISTEPLREHCGTPVIDRFDVWRQGAHAVWISGANIRAASAHSRRGDRPWVDTAGRAWRWPRANRPP